MFIEVLLQVLQLVLLTLVGQIEAKSAHVTLGIPAIGDFPATTEGVAYYKVTAVDVAGNESDPSTAGQVTEELVNTAFIQMQLSRSKD